MIVSCISRYCLLIVKLRVEYLFSVGCIFFKTKDNCSVILETSSVFLVDLSPRPFAILLCRFRTHEQVSNVMMEKDRALMEKEKEV